MQNFYFMEIKILITTVMSSFNFWIRSNVEEAKLSCEIGVFGSKLDRAGFKYDQKFWARSKKCQTLVVLEVYRYFISSNFITGLIEIGRKNFFLYV